MTDESASIRTSQIHVSPLPAVNVASVPQRSPLRYPGGKTWLVPHIRVWLRSFPIKPRLLIEPFAGGGIVSLTSVMDDLVDRCLMIELDCDVAAFWKAALYHGDELSARVLDFTPTMESVRSLENQIAVGVVAHGFRTLVLNRTRRGGILAPGASFIRAGEKGKGLASRWYPDTLVNRLREITKHANRISFIEMDGMKILEDIAKKHSPGSVIFVDPPYTADGKRAGQRLYVHNEIDHSRLFELLANSDADFLITYDYSDTVIALVEKYRFHVVQVMMKNVHHAHIPELVITSRPVFFP